jgi:ABC-type transport system involved in cytochrome c biogenesis ATPase subunit
MFRNNYLDQARKDTPSWISNKRFFCIDCGYNRIHLKDNKCPLCAQSGMDNPTDISLNIGISVIGCLESVCKGNSADSTDKQLRDILLNAIVDALPLVDGSNYTDKMPKMYVSSKDGKPITDSKLCDEIIQHYCSEYNNKKSDPQHISKISVRKLFGYHSYDLNLPGDLSIIYGSNGLGKTTVFKLLECILVSPKYTTFEKVLDNPSFLNHKIIENIEFLLNTPFSSIEICFNTGDWVKVSKKKNDDGEYELDFNYVQYGFGTTMPVYGIGRCEITRYGRSRVDEMMKHYKNIDKLFPNINNFRKFLFINVDRTKDNDLMFALKRRMTFTNGICSIEEKDLSDFFDGLRKPVFYLWCEAEISNLVSNFNQIINEEYGTKNNFDVDRPYNYSSKEIFDFIKETYETRLIKNVKDFDSVKIGGYLWPNTISLDEQEVLHNDTSYKLSKLQTRMANNAIDRNNYLQESLKLLFDAKNSNVRSVIVPFISFYENFLLLKELFENLYYEYDPSRKKVDIINGHLCLFGNSRLDFSFDNKLPFECLSSGEINIITILYYLIFRTSSGTIVLIDEPEVSLHMVWQKQFADLVDVIMKKQPGMQVIVASHSPFLTSGRDELFVGADLIDESDK